jgi:transcription elongation factor Elf1/ribosomal protein L37AE/L43A
MAQENNQRKVTIQVTGADSSNHGLHRCPTCGSAEYHRTKRTTLEHILLRPKMARCEGCGSRFLYPGRREKYPDALEVVEPVETVSRPTEERSAPEMVEESSQLEATPQVKVADYSDHGLRRCPYCGSSKYHRTKRTILDRILLRPAMAHCEKCETRFPYPRHHDKSPDSAKSGGEAGTVSHVGEQGRASHAAEESSQPNLDKQGTTADSSKGGSFRCPFCGAATYRRSRRSTLERILFRPKMARCRNCRKRFPYPKS